MDRSPHESGFVTVAGGIRLHYLDWGGSGPVLLFLTAIGCNAHIFDGFAPRFTDRFHVLALTRRAADGPRSRGRSPRRAGGRCWCTSRRVPTRRRRAPSRTGTVRC